MRKLPLVAQRTHIEQFRGNSRIEDKVAVEELDLFERLVPPWNALRYSTVPDVGLGLSVIGVWDLFVTAGDGGARIRTFVTAQDGGACVSTFSLEKG